MKKTYHAPECYVEIYMQMEQISTSYGDENEFEFDDFS